MPPDTKSGRVATFPTNDLKIGGRSKPIARKSSESLRKIQARSLKQRQSGGFRAEPTVKNNDSCGKGHRLHCLALPLPLIATATTKTPIFEAYAYTSNDPTDQGADTD
jgi:hypothetical protein